MAGFSLMTGLPMGSSKPSWLSPPYQLLSPFRRTTSWDSPRASMSVGPFAGPSCHGHPTQAPDLWLMAPPTPYTLIP